MKKQFIKIFAILNCILLIAVIGNAQSVKTSEFEVPFEFYVKDKVFPAGKYSVERINQGNPNLYMLKNANGEEKTVFLTQNTVEKQSGQPLLSFKRHGDQYFLDTVLTKENHNGHRVMITVSIPKSPKNEKSLISDTNKCLPAIPSESIGKR